MGKAKKKNKEKGISLEQFHKQEFNKLKVDN